MIGLGLQIAAVLLAVAGFTALAMAMDRHHAACFGRSVPPRRRRVLRGAGMLALLLTAAACIGAWGWVRGPVGMWGVLALGAACVMLWLRWREPAARQR